MLRRWISAVHSWLRPSSGRPGDSPPRGGLHREHREAIFDSFPWRAPFSDPMQGWYFALAKDDLPGVFEALGAGPHEPLADDILETCISEYWWQVSPARRDLWIQDDRVLPPAREFTDAFLVEQGRRFTCCSSSVASREPNVVGREPFVRSALFDAIYDAIGNRRDPQLSILLPTMHDALEDDMLPEAVRPRASCTARLLPGYAFLKGIPPSMFSRTVLRFRIEDDHLVLDAGFRDGPLLEHVVRVDLNGDDDVSE